MRNTVLAERLSMRSERMPRLLEGDVGLPGGGDSAVDTAIRSYNGDDGARRRSGESSAAGGEGGELRMTRVEPTSGRDSAVKDALRSLPNAQPQPPLPGGRADGSDERSALVVPGPNVEGLALSAAKTILDPSGIIKPDKLRVCLPMGMGPREQEGDAYHHDDD